MAGKQARWRMSSILDLASIKPFILIKSYYEMISRMLFWAWHMRNSYDWDAHTIYKTLYLKLDRITKNMQNHSHLLWNSDINTKEMRKLREARELAKRLSEDRYDMASYNETNIKFGKIIRTEEKVGEFISIKLKWHNDAEATKYFKRRNRHWAKIERQEKDRFFYLLNRYIDSWWD